MEGRGRGEDDRRSKTPKTPPAIRAPKKPDQTITGPAKAPKAISDLTSPPPSMRRVNGTNPTPRPRAIPFMESIRREAPRRAAKERASKIAARLSGLGILL